MTYEQNMQEILRAQKEKVLAKQQEAKKEREAVKEQQVLTNPSFSMHKLRRAVISYDQTQYCMPMHSFGLFWDTLVHSHKNEKNWTVHVMCSDLFAPGSCEPCKKEGYQFEAKPVKAGVMYLFNAIGEKRSFKKIEDGVEKEITYFLNPAQVIEIRNEASGADVLKSFENYQKIKVFQDNIWGIHLNKGKLTKDSSGRERRVGGGFELPIIVSPEELTQKLGKDGFEPTLPDYAREWSENITGILTKDGLDAAKKEVFRYVLTSFDNAEEIANLKGIDLPQKAQKEEIKKGFYN